MKFLMTTVALAALAASPAFAATKHAKTLASYAAADPYTVVVDGQVVGRDPDPGIRFELMRENGLQGD